MTAVVNLKPLTTSQLLDRAFRFYRSNFFLFVGIITLPQIPLAITTIFASIWMANVDPSLFTDFTPETISSGVSFFLIAFSIAGLTFLAILIAVAALSRAVFESYSGRVIGIAQAYSKIGRSWVSFLGVFFLSLLIVFFLFLIFLIPCIGWIMAIPGSGFVTFLYLVLIPLSVPVLTLEKKGAAQGLRRAWELARRRFWWALGTVLLIWLLTWSITFGPATLVQGLLFSMVDSVGLTTITVLQQLILFLIRIIVLPIPILSFILMYIDLRVRTEGLDLALAIAEEETEVSEFAMFAVDLPSPSTNWNPTGAEIGYFASITIGFALFFLAIGGIIAFLGLAIGSAFGGL